MALGLNDIASLAGGAVDLFGGNSASDIQRQAQQKAAAALQQGYGNAINLAAPMQQQSQAAFTNLNDQYGSGDFKNPTVTPYNGGSFDPNSVLSDPQYQAEMTAGTNAINSGAAGKGMEFSGNTAEALNKFGQNTFTGREDDLNSQFNTNRDFNAGQQQTAYQDNANNNQTNFNEGNTLAGYAPGALDNSINLGLGQAQAQSDSDLGIGATRANAWNTGAKKLGQGVGSLLSVNPSSAMNLAALGA